MGLLTDKLIEIIEQHKEYIKIMGEELSELTPMGYIRGWKSSRIKQGIKAREKINILQDEACKMSGLKLERLKAKGE